jgi:glycine dehydrogenase
MLDEATAAAEAMTLCLRSGKSARAFRVADDVLPQTIDVLRTRAAPLGIEVRVLPRRELAEVGAFARWCSTGRRGRGARLREPRRAVHGRGRLLVAAADLLALAILKPPGSGAPTSRWAARSASACRWASAAARGLPRGARRAQAQHAGRLVGVTVDAQGGTAYRLALQTREQHIRARRRRPTSAPRRCCSR